MISSVMLFSAIGFFFIGWTVLYLALIFHTASGFKSSAVPDIDSSVFTSILIPVRNEEKNIHRLLDAIAHQDYSKHDFEVVVINDHSDDLTVRIVEEYIASKKIEHLLLLQLGDTSGKKQALSKGVAQSKGELIITVDGDCFMLEKWLSTIVNFYQSTKAPMIVGPVLVTHTSGILSLWQHTEYMAMQVCGLGSLQRGKPLLCSGANLAFTRNAFDFVSGYSGNMAIASGDDTFLMLKMFEKGLKPESLINQNAVVTTAPLKKFKEIIYQRRRWGSKVTLYKNPYINFFGVLYLMANLCALLSLLLLPYHAEFLLVCFLPKLIIDLYVLIKGSRFFGTKMSPVILLFLMIYPVVVAVLTVYSTSGSYLWKGRKIQNKR